MIDDASKSLIDRFFNEKVSQSNGELDIQAIDTIASIKDEFDLRDVWMAILRNT